MYDDPTDEAMKLTFWVTLAFITALIVGGLMYAGVLPTFLSFERQAVQESRQYRESAVTELNGYMNAYNEAEVQIASSDNEALVEALRSQQQGNLQSMEAVFNKLGGINSLRNDDQFAIFIEFFEAHNS